MTPFDRTYWEKHWASNMNMRRPQLARRPPDPHLVEVLAELRPGLALDAGCGTGHNAAFLAAQTWRVTAVDIAPSALAMARTVAADAGPDIAERIEWVEADLDVWTPEPPRFDLVSCLYVHTPGRLEDLVRRLAAGVARGGTLLFAGHSPRDHSGSDTSVDRHRHVSVDEILAVLDATTWEVVIAEERRLPPSGNRVDAVVSARRRASPS